MNKTRARKRQPLRFIANNLEPVRKHIVFHKNKVQTKSFKTLIEIIQDRR